MHFLLTADPALGRFDYDALTNQALMEILIDGMRDKNKETFQDESGNFQHVCQWMGIDCTKDRVTSIWISGNDFSEAQFPFSFIPKRVWKLSLINCNIHGTLDPSALPHSLTGEINLSSNAMHGPLDFSTFPRMLKLINVRKNEFSGNCVLTDLPEGLQSLYASHNRFTGEIDLRVLPEQMEYLYLSDNQITGPVHIEQLPTTIKGIELSGNSLSGSLVFIESPEHFMQIWVYRNPMLQKVVVQAPLDEMQFRLMQDSITAVVDENGNTHPWEGNIVKDL